MCVCVTCFEPQRIERLKRALPTHVQRTACGLDLDAYMDQTGKQCKYYKMYSGKLKKKAKSLHRETASMLVKVTDVLFEKSRVRGVVKKVRRRNRTFNRCGRSRQEFRRLGLVLQSGMASKSKIPTSFSIGVACSDFATSSGISCVARSWSISPDACRRQVVAFARCIMEGQRMILEHLTNKMCAEDRPRLAFALAATMFDETQQKVRVRLGRGVEDTGGDMLALDNQGHGQNARVCAGTAVKTPVHVMALKLKFHWKFVGHPTPFTFEPYVPPFGVPTPSSKNLWNVLRGHRWTQQLNRFKIALLNAAGADLAIALDLWTNDNASGNDRLFAAGEAIDPREWARQVFLCLNHQHHIALMSLFSGPYELKFFGSLHGLATFCRMGVHMLTLSLSLGLFLREPGRLVVHQGTPTECDKQFVEELIDFMVQHKYKRGCADESKKRS